MTRRRRVDWPSNARSGVLQNPRSTAIESAQCGPVIRIVTQCQGEPKMHRKSSGAGPQIISGGAFAQFAARSAQEKYSLANQEDRPMFTRRPPAKRQIWRDAFNRSRPVPRMNLKSPDHISGRLPYNPSCPRQILPQPASARPRHRIAIGPGVQLKSPQHPMPRVAASNAWAACRAAMRSTRAACLLPGGREKFPSQLVVVFTTAHLKAAPSVVRSCLAPASGTNADRAWVCGAAQTNWHPRRVRGHLEIQRTAYSASPSTPRYRRPR